MQKIVDLLLFILKPVQILMQKFGRKEPKMNREAVDMAVSLIQPGDILLSYESQRFTSFFIKGKYKHAAILAPNNRVIEAVGDDFKKVNGKKINFGGVRSIDLEEWLFDKDKVAIVRPDLLPKECRVLAGANAISYIGRGYDYSFRIDKSKIYCSELIYLCYRTETDAFHDLRFKKILPEVYRDMAENEELKLVFEFQ